MKRLYLVILITVIVLSGCTSERDASPESSASVVPISSPLSTSENSASESGMGMSLGEKSVLLKDGNTFESRDGSFQMEYPEKWQIADMTPPAGNGQYGKIIQSWVLSSYVMPSAGQGGIPANSIKIDFSIEGSADINSLEGLAECEMKSITCRDVIIDKIVYRRSESILNTGMISVVYEAIHNGRYFRAQGLINSDSNDFLNEFSHIAQTFRFLK